VGPFFILKWRRFEPNPPAVAEGSSPGKCGLIFNHPPLSVKVSAQRCRFVSRPARPADVTEPRKGRGQSCPRYHSIRAGPDGAGFFVRASLSQSPLYPRTAALPRTWPKGPYMTQYRIYGFVGNLLSWVSAVIWCSCHTALSNVLAC